MYYSRGPLFSRTEIPCYRSRPSFSQQPGLFIWQPALVFQGVKQTSGFFFFNSRVDRTSTVPFWQLFLACWLFPLLPSSLLCSSPPPPSAFPFSLCCRLLSHGLVSCRCVLSACFRCVVCGGSVRVCVGVCVFVCLCLCCVVLLRAVPCHHALRHVIMCGAVPRVVCRVVCC